MVPMSVSDGPGRMPTWLEVRAVAQHAEAVGLDSAWVCDLLLSESPGQPVEGIAEGWTLLAAVAASTARLTLGTLVTPTVFRHPAGSIRDRHRQHHPDPHVDTLALVSRPAGPNIWILATGRRAARAQGGNCRLLLPTGSRAHLRATRARRQMRAFTPSAGDA